MIRKTAFAVAAVGLAALIVFPLDRNVLLVGRWERSLRPHGNDVHGADVIQSVESIVAVFHGHAPPPLRAATGEVGESSLSSSFPLIRRLTFYFPSPKHSSWQLHGWLYVRKDGLGRADVQRDEEENNKAATKPKSKNGSDNNNNQNNNSGAKTTRKPPLVVMANGLGAQKDGGLDVIAAEFAAKGFAAFIFDYGGWGGSDGTPRHIAIPNEMLNDLLAALRFVAFSPEVAAVADTAKIALWGTSLGGGHVLSMAARLAVEGKIAELDFSAAAAGGGGGRDISSGSSSSSYGSSSSPASPTKGGGGGSTSSTSPSSSPTSSGEERGGGFPLKTEMRELRRRLGCVVSQIPFISGKVQAMMSAAVRPFTTKVRLAAAILGDTAREWIGRDDLLPPIYVPLASPISPLTNNNNTSSSPLPSSSSTPSSKGEDSDADDDDDEQGERKKRDVSSSTPGDGSSVSSSSSGGGSVEYDDDDEHHHLSYGNEMGALLLEEKDYSDWLSKVPSSSAWKKTASSLNSQNSKNRLSAAETTTKSSRQFNRMFLGPWKNALAARSLFHLALYEPIDKVRDIEVPTLVVVARDDKVCDVKMAHRVADLLNGKEEDDDEGEERSSEEKKKKKKSSSSSSSSSSLSTKEEQQQEQEEMGEIEEKENNNNNNDGGAEGWRRRKASIVSIPATHFTLYFDEMRQVAVESATRFLDEHLVHHRRADY